MGNVENFDEFVSIAVPNLCVEGAGDVDVLWSRETRRCDFHSLGEG